MPKPRREGARTSGKKERGETRATPRPEGNGRGGLPALGPVRAPAAAPEPAAEDPALYLNRELSWLDFNWRVVHLALDEAVPLLERIRFLAIAESNLDEFFAKRVGALKRQQRANAGVLSPDGRSPAEQLALIRETVAAMQRVMTDLWEEELRPRLQHEAGVVITSYAQLDEAERHEMDAYFRTNIYPILTPLAVDPGHPFPFISSQSLSLAVLLEHPVRHTEHFARVKVPTGRQRWIPVGGPLRVLPIEELVLRHVGDLFPGMRLVSAHQFRVTRSVDLERDDEEIEDVIQTISEELRARRFAPVVQLEVEPSMPEHVRELLRDELELDPADLYESQGLLDLTGLFGLAELDVLSLRFAVWEPVTPPRVLEGVRPEEPSGIFDVIRGGDLLVHHPYESFTSTVQHFIEAAAIDPRVLAIKQTLYRTSEDSPVVRALIRAAESGKQVAVMVEVTARFDEEKNIGWAQALERAGVHVTYGLVGLKTHAKVVLVVREEAGGIRTYCHVGTGNYHVQTARLYTDIGLLTADPAIGRDVVNLFHFLTGYAPEQHYAELVVAPRDMRAAFMRLIDQEIEHHRAGGDGRIILKMNAIDDVAMIRKLYEASRAGVRVDLIVRGHSRLRPGVPGASENIRVTSILGRFLEHDRIFYFHNAGDPRLFIGSADWRRRNLEERVEAMVPVHAPELKARLLGILLLALSDNRLAWDLGAGGRYVLRRPDGREERSFQSDLMTEARARSREAESDGAPA
ncbi:MAG TPA: polyphosphate kinase 1 [Longimicrobiales bacterium]|nr:polyphosphate kinase 1 [Longimicrobiales bacterium]